MMSNIHWVKPSFPLILCVGCMLGLVGCSESVSSEADAGWIQSDWHSEFERQSDRPPTAKTLWAIAEILATQGRDRECRYVLNRIIQQDPSFLPAYNSLAELQMRQGHTNTAIETLEDGLRVNPRDTVLLNNMGMCWIARRDNEAALEMFTSAAGAAPENPKYRANMAVALGLMGRDEESLSLFNKVLPVDLANKNLAVFQKRDSIADPDNSVPIARPDHEQAQSIAQ